jgi:type I site-specific restriction-modification system R (restriction) subunit
MADTTADNSPAGAGAPALRHTLPGSVYGLATPAPSDGVIAKAIAAYTANRKDVPNTTSWSKAQRLQFTKDRADIDEPFISAAVVRCMTVYDASNAHTVPIKNTPAEVKRRFYEIVAQRATAKTAAAAVKATQDAGQRRLESQHAADRAQIDIDRGIEIAAENASAQARRDADAKRAQERYDTDLATAQREAADEASTPAALAEADEVKRRKRQCEENDDNARKMYARRVSRGIREHSSHVDCVVDNTPDEETTNRNAEDNIRGEKCTRCGRTNPK